MVKYVKGTILNLFCFGEKKKKRQEELGKILIDMYKNSTAISNTDSIPVEPEEEEKQQ